MRRGPIAPWSSIASNCHSVTHRSLSIMPSNTKRMMTRAGVATAILAAGALAVPPSAVAAQSDAKKFDYQDASYILTMRAGAVEPYAMIPRDLPTDIGFSYVDLIHD